ncbi:MAG: hypothetical protein ACREFU_01460 [Acetobacteraceae bacterium]
MSATSRLMVLMSSEERAALDAKARTLGVSAGEMVRRAVHAYDLAAEVDARELRTLIEAFNQVHPETLRIADESHRTVTRLLGNAARPRGSTRGSTQGSTQRAAAR